MHIKTENGEANVTSQGQGSLNTVLGAVGTAGALGMLNGGLNLFGNRPPMSDSDRPVTRYELDLVRENIAKDSEIAALRANMYTNAQVNSVKQQLCDFEKQQSVYNGVANATVKCIQEQIAQLQSMTRLVIPNQNIAPGWGPFPPFSVVPVTQSQSTTTTAASSTQAQG